MTFDRYQECIDKIEKMCLKLGLSKSKGHYVYSFFIKSSILNLYGEVIRLFPYDTNLPTDNKIVFFNKLKNSSSTEEDYIYKFENNELMDRLKLRNNFIYFDEVSDKAFSIILKKLENIIKDCIEQKKKEEEIIKLKRINGDF